jgi:hypothetical protein
MTSSATGTAPAARPSETVRAAARTRVDKARARRRDRAEDQAAEQEYRTANPSEHDPATPAPAGESSAAAFRRRLPRPSAGGVVDNGAGIILAFLAWVWVIDPFLQKGTQGAKDVLRAKFFNKDAKGNWLP